MVVRALVFASLALVGFAGSALAATPAEVKAALEAKFTLTTRGMLGGVKTPGTVLVVQQDGIRISKPSGVSTPAHINGGRLTAAGGGGILDTSSGHTLKRGERVYVLSVKPEKKWVLFQIMAVDGIDVVENGSSRLLQFQAFVSFQYDEGVDSVSAETIVKDIEAWFKTQDASDAANTKTVALGQTPDEVTAILGAPEKKVELGAKTMFVYKDMKVVFQDGKVADVQ